MSRKSLDEQSPFAETLAPALNEQIINDEDKLNLQINQRKKRNDWTEYLDPEDNHIEEREEVEQNGGGFEANVVTELFKKPRLENYSTGLDSGGSDKLFKPHFSKTNTNEKIILQEERMKDQQENNSKWKNYIALDDQGPQRCRPTINRATAKWNDYITEEDDSLQLGWKRAFKDHTDLWNSVLEAITNEQRVEDDIHPDFM